MSDLRELYQQVILDHNKNPRNFHELPNATKSVDGYNRDHRSVTGYASLGIWTEHEPAAH